MDDNRTEPKPTSLFIHDSSYCLLIVTISACSMVHVVLFLQSSSICFIQSCTSADLALMGTTVSLNWQGIAFACIRKKLRLLMGEITLWRLWYEEWCNKLGWTLSIFRIHLVKGEKERRSYELRKNTVVILPCRRTGSEVILWRGARRRKPKNSAVIRISS